jgi:hypothetical protein
MRRAQLGWTLYIVSWIGVRRALSPALVICQQGYTKNTYKSKKSTKPFNHQISCIDHIHKFAPTIYLLMGLENFVEIIQK